MFALGAITDTKWITSAKYISGYRNTLEFNNGTSGEVNFEGQFQEAIFQPSREKKYFKNFKLGDWTIEWKNGADFAPEFLYGLVRKTGP